MKDVELTWQPSQWNACAVLRAPPSRSPPCSVTFLPSSIHGHHYLCTPWVKKWELVWQLVLPALVQPPLMPCPSEELFDTGTLLVFCKHTFADEKGFLLLPAITNFQPFSPWELQSHHACEDPGHLLQQLQPLRTTLSPGSSRSLGIPQQLSSPWSCPGSRPQGVGASLGWGQRTRCCSCSAPSMLQAGVSRQVCSSISGAQHPALTHPATAARTPKPVL